VYNTAMYTVYGRCGQYGRFMVHTLAGAPVRPVRGLYGPGRCAPSEVAIFIEEEEEVFVILPTVSRFSNPSLYSSN